jgi:hypothetical protein
VHPRRVERNVAADRMASELFRRPWRERAQRATYGVMRTGGRALDLLPAPIRPKIRHSDRTGTSR